SFLGPSASARFHMAFTAGGGKAAHDERISEMHNILCRVEGQLRWQGERLQEMYQTFTEPKVAIPSEPRPPMPFPHAPASPMPSPKLMDVLCSLKPEEAHVLPVLPVLPVKPEA
ncbi:unnamed protein product, partial [Effrenium voratum]